MPIEPTPRPFRKLSFPDFLWLLTMLRLRPLAEGGMPWPLVQVLALDHGGRKDVAHGLLHADEDETCLQCAKHPEIG